MAPNRSLPRGARTIRRPPLDATDLHAKHQKMADELIADLRIVPKTKAARHDIPDFSGKALGRFEYFASYFGPVVDMFVNLRYVFEDGLQDEGIWEQQYNTCTGYDDDEEDYPSEEEAEATGPNASDGTEAEGALDQFDDKRLRKINLEAWHRLCKMHPAIRPVIVMIAQKNDAKVYSLAKAMKDQLTQSMADHRKKMKQLVLDLVWMSAGDTAGGKDTESRITSLRDKTQRGLAEPTIARLLCPFKHLSTLLKDRASFVAQVDNGSIQVQELDWPSCFYPSDIIYNPEDPSNGLFRSQFLVLAWKLTFMYNVTIERKSEPEPPKIIKKVTGRTIAYVAMLTRFSLTDDPSWSDRDAKFHCPTFYYAILDLFETYPDDPWVINTLAWWQEQIFTKNPSGNSGQGPPPRVDPATTDAGRMLADRRARHQQRN